MVYATGLVVAFVDYEVLRHVGRHSSSGFGDFGLAAVTSDVARGHDVFPLFWWVLGLVWWLILGLFVWALHCAGVLVIAAVTTMFADSFLGRERPPDDDSFLDVEMVHIFMTIMVVAVVVFVVVFIGTY